MVLYAVKCLVTLIFCTCVYAENVTQESNPFNHTRHDHTFSSDAHSEKFDEETPENATSLVSEEFSSEASPSVEQVELTANSSTTGSFAATETDLTFSTSEFVRDMSIDTATVMPKSAHSTLYTLSNLPTAMENSSKVTQESNHTWHDYSLASDAYSETFSEETSENATSPVIEKFSLEAPSSVEQVTPTSVFTLTGSFAATKTDLIFSTSEFVRDMSTDTSMVMPKSVNLSLYTQSKLHRALEAFTNDTSVSQMGNDHVRLTNTLLPSLESSSLDAIQQRKESLDTSINSSTNQLHTGTSTKRDMIAKNTSSMGILTTLSKEHNNTNVIIFYSSKHLLYGLDHGTRMKVFHETKYVDKSAKSTLLDKPTHTMVYESKTSKGSNIFSTTREPKPSSSLVDGLSALRSADGRDDGVGSSTANVSESVGEALTEYVSQEECSASYAPIAWAFFGGCVSGSIILAACCFSRKYWKRTHSTYKLREPKLSSMPLV